MTSQVYALSCFFLSLMLGVLLVVRARQRPLQVSLGKEEPAPKPFLHVVHEEAEDPMASVPFMVTSEMRRKLRGLGYTDESIDRMTPKQAQEILRQLPAEPS